MKKVLLGTLAVLTLAACSKDEVIQQNPNDEISFSVVTNKAISRAENGFCNKHTPKRFVVSASYTKDGSTKQYFLNDKFKKKGSTETDNEYVAFETNRYWPDLTGGASMTFYAATDGTKETTEGSWDTKPVSVLPTWKSSGTDFTGMEILGYTVEDDVDKQRDLLYAVEVVSSNPGSDGVQNINFRHGLSQIEFAAINENDKIHVEICGVSIVNVKNKGNFTFPESTSDKIGEHNGKAPYPTDPKKVGSWTIASDAATKTYATATLDPVVAVGATSTSLTVDNKSGEEYHANTMYLIPQKLTAWDRSNNAVDETEKSYFLVKAKIWNVAGATFNGSTDVLLWGTGASGNATGAKDIAIPTDAATWQPGKRYVYTFKFTKTGEGGANPGDNSDVLIPIKLQVTVDDFVDGTGAVIPMDKNP